MKAALCHASPVLLLEGGGRFKDRALLRLAGYEPASVTDEQLFTVGFSQAIHRLQLLHGDDVLGVGRDDLNALKSARDVTAHGGQVADATGDSLFRVFVTLATTQNKLAALLESTPETFWGPAWSTVEKALRDHKDALKQQLVVAYATAQKRFAERTRDLDDDAISGLLEQAGERVQATNTAMPRKCPVCGGKGLSTERPEQRPRSGRGRKVERGWMAVNFSCPICHLTLESEALVKAAPGFDPWESADEFDLMDYWERDMAELDAIQDIDDEAEEPI